MTTIDAKVEEIKPGAASEARASSQTQTDTAAPAEAVEVVEEQPRRSKFKLFTVGLVSGVVLALCVSAVPAYFSFESARTTENALSAAQSALTQARVALAEVQADLREEQAARKSLEINIAQGELDDLSAELAEIAAQEKVFQALMAKKSVILSQKRDSEKRVDALTEELMDISNGQ